MWNLKIHISKSKSKKTPINTKTKLIDIENRLMVVRGGGVGSGIDG